MITASTIKNNYLLIRIKMNFLKRKNHYHFIVNKGGLEESKLYKASS